MWKTTQRGSGKTNAARGQGQVIIPTVTYISLANGQVPLMADYGKKVASHMLAHLQCPTGLMVVQQASPSPCDKDIGEEQEGTPRSLVSIPWHQVAVLGTGSRKPVPIPGRL